MNPMHIIADSSNTRTHWVIVDGNRIVETAYTIGLNPFFLSRREISHNIRLELPDIFFRRKYEHVYFYGAGCNSVEKQKIVHQSLTAHFRTKVSVNSDLLGAARGLLVREPGLACILGTGSNSCYYNGSDIEKNVPPLGYILGDEGSGCSLGKWLIADVIRGIAPRNLVNAFFEKFSVTTVKLMDEIYSSKLPARTLASFASFLADNIEEEYCRDLVYRSFRLFFERNLIFYDYKNLPVSFVGSTATIFKEILLKSATDFGLSIRKIEPSSMPGLITYHSINS